ncbi:glutathione S-transferase N-terminal domain-containing protein [Serratia ureilytica]
MKLIGSYTSPFVRKISVMLLEKGIAFEFVNDPPYEPGSRVKEQNPLGKVPVLIADDGEVFYDSPIVAEYLELLTVEPAFLPADRAVALRVRQVAALAQEKTWLNAERLTLADIATGCALGYLNFRRILPNWCVQRPALVKLAERLFARESFARTAPP